MDLGLVIDPRLNRSWEETLELAVRNGISFIEPCGGGHVPKDYVDPVRLDADDGARQEFVDSIASHGLKIAALGCYGNPIHPDEARAEAARDDFAAMCSLAEKLEVKRVTVISGVPAGGPSDRVPNWIIPSIYADLEAAYKWQWEERLIPYWQKACAIAKEHDVLICMEPIGGFTVYNGQTFLRLREACGPTLNANVDPSHLWWMGIDPVVFVEQLRGAVGYVHAKDVALDSHRVAKDGIAPACRYDDWESRTWTYRAIGFGHSERFWKTFFTALRRGGYDDVVSVEIEESFMSADEALDKSVQLLDRALPREPIPTENWFDQYRWESARVE